MSISYYDTNSAAFFAGSVAADMSAGRARFLAHVPTGGAILDAGCGSGRDTLAFKQAGFAVTAFDASAEMVRLSREHSGLPVLHLRFADLQWDCAFDGVWTCASLLHVPRADLEDAMARLARALKPGGAWFISFKYGDTERFTDRHFTDMNEALLTATIARTGLTAIDMWTSTDVRPERATERWISAIAKR